MSYFIEFRYQDCYEFIKDINSREEAIKEVIDAINGPLGTCTMYFIYSKDSYGNCKLEYDNDQLFMMSKSLKYAND